MASSVFRFLMFHVSYYLHRYLSCVVFGVGPTFGRNRAPQFLDYLLWDTNIATQASTFDSHFPSDDFLLPPSARCSRFLGIIPTVRSPRRLVPPIYITLRRSPAVALISPSFLLRLPPAKFDWLQLDSRSLYWAWSPAFKAKASGNWARDPEVRLEPAAAV